MKKFWMVKVRWKSVISEKEIVFLESLNPPSQIPAYATDPGASIPWGNEAEIFIIAI